MKILRLVGRVSERKPYKHPLRLTMPHQDALFETPDSYQRDAIQLSR